MFPKFHQKRCYFIIQKSKSLGDKILETMRNPRSDQKEKVLKFSALISLLKKLLRISGIEKQFSEYLALRFRKNEFQFEKKKEHIKKTDFVSEFNTFFYQSIFNTGKIF